MFYTRKSEKLFYYKVIPTISFKYTIYSLKNLYYTNTLLTLLYITTLFMPRNIVPDNIKIIEILDSLFILKPITSSNILIRKIYTLKFSF